MKLRNLILSTFTLLLISSSLQAADGPAYALDSMTDHPYRFTPAYGHASQNPGSPKYFVPGYGYRIPGFGSGNGFSSSNSYTDHYTFGIRKPGSYNDTTHQYWDNSYGGPWYIPGSSTNLKSRFPNW